MALIDLFINREETSAVEETPKQQEVTTSPVNAFTQKPQPQSAPAEIPSSAYASQTVGSDETIVQKLLQTLVEHNLPGPDYLELKNDASNLSEYIKGEEAQYAAAFKVLKGRYPDFDKTKILTSIDKYKAMMEAERKSGLEEARQAIAAADNSGEVNALLAEAKKLESDIAKMSRELDEKRKRAEALQMEMNSKKTGLERGMKVFNASVDTVVGILDSDKEKISRINI